MPNSLRTHAEERIKEGTAPATRSCPPGAQALTLLHRLASEPESAADALKLLHELQVHQVELDLQQEQAEQERGRLAEDLRHSNALFEVAPFAYLTLDAQDRVSAVNRAATEWLGPAVGQGRDCTGHPIEDLLATSSHAALRELLAALRKDGGSHSCVVQPRVGQRRAQAVATARPEGGTVLLALVPLGPAAVT